MTPAAPRAQTVTALVKALASAHRWQRMLDSCDYATVAEIAAAEKINASYASRVLRPTLLAPEIVEAILDRRQPAGVTLGALLRPFSSTWKEQRSTLTLST